MRQVAGDVLCGLREDYLLFCELDLRAAITITITILRAHKRAVVRQMFVEKDDIS